MALLHSITCFPKHGNIVVICRSDIADLSAHHIVIPMPEFGLMGNSILKVHREAINLGIDKGHLVAFEI